LQALEGQLGEALVLSGEATPGHLGRVFIVKVEGRRLLFDVVEEQLEEVSNHVVLMLLLLELHVDVLVLMVVVLLELHERISHESEAAAFISSCLLFDDEAKDVVACCLEKITELSDLETHEDHLETLAGVLVFLDVSGQQLVQVLDEVAAVDEEAFDVVHGIGVKNRPINLLDQIENAFDVEEQVFDCAGKCLLLLSQIQVLHISVFLAKHSKWISTTAGSLIGGVALVVHGDADVLPADFEAIVACLGQLVFLEHEDLVNLRDLVRARVVIRAT